MRRAGGSDSDGGSLQSIVSLESYPCFVRKVARPTRWEEPRDTRDIAGAAKVFYEVSRSVSMWLVRDDRDLRRVAIAMNEFRGGSKREKVVLLPVRPDELSSAGIAAQPTPQAARTSCEGVRALHHDMDPSDRARNRLAEVLVNARRGLASFTKAKMKQALELAIQEGCFAAVPGSRQCACGATK